MKKIIFSISIIMLILTGCSNKKINEQELITEYVKNNESELVEVLSQINFEEKLNEKSLISSLPRGIKIIGAYIASDSCIEFDVGEGLVTSSHYYGFYYTLLDKPLAAGIEDNRLTESGNGYKIQVPGNEDWYYTEKIVDNFYFYEAHY